MKEGFTWPPAGRGEWKYDVAREVKHPLQREEVWLSLNVALWGGRGSGLAPWGKGEHGLTLQGKGMWPSPVGEGAWPSPNLVLWGKGTWLGSN